MLYVVICALLPFVHGANILFVAVSPSVSHQIVFQAVWKELSLRGHHVYAITPNPLNDPTLTNLTEIDVSSIYEIVNAIPPDVGKYMFMKPDFLTVFTKDSFMTLLFNQLNELTFRHENVQKFLRTEHKFDVAIIEWLFPTMAAFGAKYNCPIIGITSLGAPIVALDTVGNPSHPIYAPDHNLPVTRDMNFRERLMSVLYSIYVRLYYNLAVLPREDALARKYLGDDLPYLKEIETSVSLLLLNRNPVFHRVMPTVPAVIELGGIQIARPKQTIEKELQAFLDASDKGVVYFSLGSNIKSVYLPERIRNVFRDTFAQLPFNVVWKWEGGDLPGKSNNVFTRPWLPQQELLGHRNVKLFITQGGLQSTQDAIRNHVPIIGIPFHSDQTANVDTCVKYGMGHAIDLMEITATRLNASIREIMENSSYHENAKQLDEVMDDQPTDGLEKAIWWTEYVIRHKGAKHLRSSSLDIPWVQYLMLDVFAFLAALSAALLFILYLGLKIVRYLIISIYCVCFRKSVKEAKKTQ